MSTSIESFLKDFHKKHPGCTPAAFSNGFTIDGLTSYDMATSLLPANSKVAETVLDLACGDGVLLQKISQFKNESLTLIGVDMSVGELDAARKRLGPSSTIKLFEVRAQSLPVPDCSVDHVLCHMAFMLMDEIEQVVSEIHRVLKPGGTFSAVVGGNYVKTPVMDAFLHLLDEALKEESKSWLSSLGDKRTRSEDGLRSLFEGGRFVQPITVQDFSIYFDEQPTDLMDFFMLMYEVGLLSPSRQIRLANDLLGKLESMTNAGGKINHSMGMRQIVCSKAGAIHG